MAFRHHENGNVVSTEQLHSAHDRQYGTTNMCTLQGFVFQFGLVSSGMFNIALSITYLLIVRYNWSSTKVFNLQNKLQWLIWLLSLAFSIIFIPLNMYNYFNQLCWIEAYPLGCTNSIPKFGEETVDPAVDGNDDIYYCTRGDNAWIAQYVFGFFPMIPCICISIVSMILIYKSVRQIEMRAERYTFGGVSGDTSRVFASSTFAATPSRLQMEQQRTTAVNAASSRTKSRKVAIQGVLYISVYMLVFLPSILYSTIVLTVEQQIIDVYLFDIIFFGLLLPLQGFLNCIIYMRNSQMKTAEGKIFQKVLQSLKNCCCFTRNHSHNNDNHAQDVDDAGHTNRVSDKSSGDVRQQASSKVDSVHSNACCIEEISCSSGEVTA